MFSLIGCGEVRGEEKKITYLCLLVNAFSVFAKLKPQLEFPSGCVQFT